MVIVKIKGIYAKEKYLNHKRTLALGRPKEDRSIGKPTKRHLQWDTHKRKPELGRPQEKTNIRTPTGRLYRDAQKGNLNWDANKKTPASGMPSRYQHRDAQKRTSVSGHPQKDIALRRPQVETKIGTSTRGHQHQKSHERTPTSGRPQEDTRR